MNQLARKIDLIGGEPDLERDIVAPRSSTVRDGIVPMTICLIVALTPLVFTARLLEPYIAAKEIFVQAGTATAGLLWLLTARANIRTLTPTAIWVPIVVLVLVSAMSLLWSSNSSVSFEEGQRLITYVLLFAIAAHVMQQAEARNALATALLLAGGIEAVYVLLQYSIGDPIFLTGQLLGKWQTFGTLGNPNWTGEFLAVAALVSLARVVEVRTKTSLDAPAKPFTGYLTIATLILMLLALAATLARGAWLAFVVGTAAFVIARRFSHVQFRLRPIIVPLAITTVAGILVIVLPLAANPAALNHLSNLKSINGRILMSAVSWTMITEAPVLGHGLGTYGLRFPVYQAQILTQDWAARFIPNASFTTYAHNDYLQLWAETGIFGLIAFGAIGFIVLKRGRKLSTDPVALGCWAAVISLLVNAAVAFPLHLPTTLMLFVVLIAAVGAAASKKNVGLSNLPIAARVVIVLVTLILCFSAYRSGYNRFVSESALWRANAALGNDQWDEAEAAILTAMQHAPTRLDGHAMLGRLHVERAEYEQALLVLDQSERLGFDEEVFDLKAKTLEALGRRTEAIAVLNDLVRLRPDLQWPRERLNALGAGEQSRGD